MPRASLRSSPTLEEKRNVSEFFAAACECWGGQTQLADATGIRQPTINGIMNRKALAGHRSLFAVSRVTGISIEEIMSGVGTARLRSRGPDAVTRVAQLSRLQAIRALSELYSMPVTEVEDLFDELGIILPVEVPATAWFDVGRSAIERRALGLALAKRIE